MSSEPSRPGEAVRIHAVRDDNRDDALRKIARACIAIARQQLVEDPDGAEQSGGSTPPPALDAFSKPQRKSEADHA
jgi:hypothetical protein